MPDPTPDPDRHEPEAGASGKAGNEAGPEGAPPPRAAAPPGGPIYRGEPLDAERGPGLGCFWVQIVVLGVLLILTPLTVVWAWDERISAVLLIATLGLLLFAGQTVIFLLRLVAADRRTRRRPLGESARRTVGQLDDEATARTEPESPPDEPGPPGPSR